MTAILFVGLGQMGLRMAASLARAGHAVTAADIAAEPREQAASQGLPTLADPTQAIGDAAMVITMFGQGSTVLDVWATLAPLARPGTLFMDCSTIAVQDARAAHALAAAHDLLGLDAPVTGGVAGAQSGSLLFMAGGTDAAFDAAAALFAAMGSHAVHCGAAGAGQAAKLANNMLLGISMVATADAFRLARAEGVPDQALFDVMSQSSGQCWSLTSYCPAPGPVPQSPANHGFAPGFTAARMANDLGLALAAATATAHPPALAAAARDAYHAMIEAGRGEADFSAVIDLPHPAPRTQGFTTLRVERRDRVALITLDRPRALNALNLRLLQELLAALQACDADRSVGCIVLTGSPRAFAAGADIKEMQAMGFEEAYRRDWCAGWEGVGRIRTPILGAVAGFALGGGCEVAMMCDLLVAADTARFGQPEITLGTLPGMGGSQRLTRLVGKPRAMELCLTGRTIDAAEAERIGLVSRVYPAASFLEDALALAAQIAAQPPEAAMMVKEAINTAYETTLAQGLHTERRLFQASFSTAAKSEGMQAFTQKRPPNFRYD